MGVARKFYKKLFKVVEAIQARRLTDKNLNLPNLPSLPAVVYPRFGQVGGVRGGDHVGGGGLGCGGGRGDVDCNSSGGDGVHFQKEAGATAVTHTEQLIRLLLLLCWWG